MPKIKSGPPKARITPPPPPQLKITAVLKYEFTAPASIFSHYDEEQGDELYADNAVQATGIVKSWVEDGEADDYLIEIILNQPHSSWELEIEDHIPDEDI